MATCAIDRISVVCDGGCGLICTSTQCWSWCEPPPSTTVPAVMTFLKADVAPAPPDGSEELKLCTTELSRAALVAGLEKVLGTTLTDNRTESPREETEDVSFSGTVDELLQELQLGREGYG